MSETVKFYDDYIGELVNTAKSAGWDVMVKDAYNFVNDHCAWKDQEDKHNLIKILISNVGFELKKIIAT